MLEKFLAVLERIADAVEVIASAKSAGASAPRIETAVVTKDETVKVDAPKDEADAEAKKKADAAAKRKAKDEAAKKEKAAKEAAADPLGDSSDPLGDAAEKKKEYSEKEVREILAKLIDQDGRAAAFEVLKDKGGGAKAFTDLRKEHYEDVFVECQERLG